MRAKKATRAMWASGWLLGSSLALSLFGACEPDLDPTRTTPDRGSFGAIVYQESCERVAWTGQLDEQAAGLRSTLDVSGSLYDAVCAMNQPAPATAPVRLLALQAQRSTLVRVVDQVLPQNFLSSLQAFLEAIEVLDDDGTMEATMTSVGSLLQTMINDPGFAPALSRIAGRVGYRPARLAAGLAHATLGWPGSDDLLQNTLNLLLDDKGQPGPELAALLQALSHELGSVAPLDNPADPTRTLRVALDLLLSPARDVAAGKPYLAVLRDARGVARVAPDGSGALPAPFVDKNGDKQADIDEHGRFAGADGKPLAIGAPFLPPAGIDPPMQKRDAAGRLLGAGGQPAFQYLDLDGTVLAGLLREQMTLADPMKDDLVGLVHGASGLLGARVARTRDYRDSTGHASTLSYQGFAVERAPLLDLAHAYVQLLGAPRAPDLLTGAGTLLDKYEDPMSRALAAMLDVSARGAKATHAQIPAASTLYDDLIPIIVRVLAVPGLTEDLMSALVTVTDKRLLGLAPMIAQQMLYKDRFVLNQSTDPNQQTSSGSYQTPVEHGSPDVDWNRSVMQRMMHLVHDANGVQFCNKQGAQVKVGFLPLATYDRCKMFEIDDLGLFFALTIADKSIVDDVNRPETRNMASFREHLQSAALKTLITDGAFGDNTIESLTGITGFTRFPTPQAAARSLFLDQQHQSSFMQNSIDPVQCSDGDRFIDVHGDSIFAWEATLANNPSGNPGDTFYDAVKPLINAFAKHDECLSYDGNKLCTQKRNAAKIFLDLLSVLHVHWASPQSSYFGHQFQSADPRAARFSTGDAALTYEPLLGDVLGASDLVPSIINLAPVLNTAAIDGANGPALRPVLIDTLHYVFDPAAAPPGLTYRDGSIKTTFSDGKTPGPRVTPYYLLADAYAKKRLALAATSADRAGSWRSATSDLVDDALTVSTTMSGARLLKNRRLHGVTLSLIAFLNGRIAAHAAAKDLDAWVHKSLVSDLSDSAGGPTMAALADVVAKLEHDPSTLRSVYGLLQTLGDESAGGAFPTGLSAIADVLQILLDDVNLAPVAHTIGAILDPSRLSAPLGLMKRSRDLDPRVPDGKQHSTLGTVLANFFQDTPGGAPPMSDLADSLAEINRAAPGKGGDLDATDYRTIFGQVQGFLTDDVRGFVKFVHVVKNRTAPAN